MASRHCAMLVAAAVAGTPALSQPTVLRQGLSAVDPNAGTAAVSADGRFIAFMSQAQLLPDDGNAVADIYVLDRVTGALTLESIAPHGGPANGSSQDPHISADGRFVVFVSVAANLTPVPDRNGCADVYLRDRIARVTTRISVAHDGGDADNPSGPAVVSGDGTAVVFVSSATNLVPQPDANGISNDIYLAHRASGRTSRVSVDNNGRQFDVSQSPSLDASGRLVAFAARPRLSPNGADQRRSELRVYLRDFSNGKSVCLSCDGDPIRAAAPAFAPRINGDGRVVVFVVQTGPQRTDVALHDRAASRTTILTGHANADSRAPAISGDGRVVVFVSWASDVLCRRDCEAEAIDDNLLPDVYAVETETRRIRRVSGSNRIWWAPSLAPSLDAHGSTVVFSSRQPFGPEDETVDFDLFVCTPTCG